MTKPAEKKSLWPRYLLIAAGIFHFLALHVLGLACFSTTIVFYLLVYLLIRSLSRRLFRPDMSRLITLNTRNFFLLLLVLEFLLTFAFRIENNYLENSTGIYLSPYKKNQLTDLLHRYGFKKTSNPTRSGYVPFSSSEHRTAEFSYPVQYNSLGLRGNEPGNPDTAAFRILVLGDSYTEGFGAPGDSTFPVLLQQALQPRLKYPVEVLNAGICGSSPIDNIILFRNRLQSYPADLVLLVSNLTDIFDIEYAFHPNRMPLSEYFIATSHLYRLFYWGMFRQGLADANSSKRVQDARDANIRQLTDSLNQFRELLAGQGKHFALVYLPLHSEVRYFYQDIPPTPALAGAYHAGDIPLIDLRPPYQAHILRLDELDRYYWRRDGHHNARGYRLMARTVADTLVARKWVGAEKSGPGFPNFR